MDKILALCTCPYWLVSQNFSLMIHFTFKILLAWHCDIRVRIRKIAESKALALCVANPSTILSTAYASLSIAKSSTTRWDPKTKRVHMLPITSNIYLLSHYTSPQAPEVTLPPTLLTHNNPFCQTPGNRCMWVDTLIHVCESRPLFLWHIFSPWPAIIQLFQVGKKSKDLHGKCGSSGLSSCLIWELKKKHF